MALPALYGGPKETWDFVVPSLISVSGYFQKAKAIKVMNDKLTTDKYWDSTYSSRGKLEPVSLHGYKNRCTRAIFSKKRPIVEGSDSILEIGGGGSAWLAYLATAFPNKRFASLDFSEKGNRLLRDYAEDNNLQNIDVEEGDFFTADLGEKRFDFIYSHGVVEHFQNLPEVLLSHSRFVAERGKMLTIIPNMAGILGVLTRKMDKQIYDIHVPHDLRSFEKGHQDAGLNIVESGYLCSSNFGVLSSCITTRSGFRYSFYKQLTRVSKLIWLYEDKFFELPKSKLFSPYLYVLSEKA